MTETSSASYLENEFARPEGQERSHSNIKLGDIIILFDPTITQAQSEPDNTLSYSHPLNLRYSEKLSLPLVAEGAFSKDRRGKIHFSITIFPDKKEISQPEYLTDVKKILRARILLVVKETTLSLTLPTGNSEATVILTPKVTKDKKDFAFTLTQEDMDHFSPEDVLDNWSKIKAVFKREE
jgi:hypothetical protein